MMNVFRKVLSDISTGLDGKTFCYARVVGHVGIVSFIALSIADFISTHHFNYTAFGIGFGSIMGSVGGAIWAKQDTEPKQ